MEEDSEIEDLEISRGRKFSLKSVNFACELISFYENDNFSTLQKVAFDSLTKIKKLDKDLDLGREL
jgi:hypothetical protein